MPCRSGAAPWPMLRASSIQSSHPRCPPMCTSLHARPKANVVMAHATNADKALVLRLSSSHDCPWWMSASLEAPTTSAKKRAAAFEHQIMPPPRHAQQVLYWLLSLRM